MATLGSLLYTALQNSGKNPTDDVLSDELSKAFENYYETGSVTTADTGSVSAGAFVGTGSSVSIKGNSSGCKSTILAGCTAMKYITEGGNSTFASAVADGVTTLCSYKGITCNVKGSATSGSTTTVLSDTSLGSLAIVTATLKKNLEDLFADMNAKDDESYDDYKKRLEIGSTYKDEDDYLAQKMGNLVKTAITGGAVSTQGQNSLSGSSGSGKMSFTE